MSVGVERTFDRREEFDERSRDYPIMATIEVPKPRSYTWSCPFWLDQRREGACVGFAWAHEAAAKPVPRPTTEAFAREIYRRAQQLDQWPGEGYEGTSVIAGAKAMRERGYLGEFRWAFGLNDLLVAISRKGPAVLGIPWYEGMLNPDKDGFIHPTGERVGGHAILGPGVSVRSRYVLLKNSWGRDWGVEGACRISWEDMERLLHEGGEACIPVLR